MPAGPIPPYHSPAMAQPMGDDPDLRQLVAYRGRPLRVMQVMAGGKSGGAETFFVSLVLALHRAGLDQLAVIRGNLGRSFALRNGGMVPVELPFGRWLDFTTVPVLRRQIRIYQPDIVMTWMNRASALCPRGEFLRLARLGGYYKIKNYRRCDHLICNTPDLVEHVVAEGWPRDRAHVIPNFSHLEATDAVPRSSLDTPEDAPLLVALGRLHPAKALDILLRALTIETRAYLWIAGEGPLRGELEALAQDLGVAQRVRFLGWREDRGALLAAADVCVFPSRSEPFGTVILDAWASRRPLVAAASAGPRWLVRDGEDGLLVPIEDATALAAAIARVLDDAGLRDRLVAAGRRRYEEGFTEAACVTRYLRLFQELLAARNAARGAGT